MSRDSDGIRYRKLWERGISLWAAVSKFAHPELRKRYEEIEAARPKIDDVKPDESEKVSIDDGFWKAADLFFDKMQPVMGGLSERNKVRAAMENNVAQYIQEGQLVAFGFQSPRSIQDHPWPIPKELWGHIVKWDSGRVSGQGLDFIEVRLMPAQWEPKILGELVAPDTKRPGQGRPTVKPFIDGAYDALLAAGHIQAAPSMAAVADLIRSWLVEVYPDRAGQFEKLADETIRLQVTDRFKADRQKF